MENCAYLRKNPGYAPEAVDRWATEQSKRQGITPDGESKRRILAIGEEIAKAIRFPLMSQQEFASVVIGPIYTRDGSSVQDELGQRTIARLIIRLCINTGKQTDHPSRRAITIIRLVRRIIADNSSRRMIRRCV